MESSQNAKESLSRGASNTGMYPLGSNLSFTTICFGRRLSSARMVIECAFGRLKARFDCLKREMDINLKELPAVIHSCFILHNFCEIRQEAVNQNGVLVAQNYDVEFQPETDTGYEINNNKAGDKRIRNIFFEYFE